MTEEQVMGELWSLGTEQNRKVYRRHGVGERLCGVSFAHLKALRKRIKTNHDLAQRLWITGNHDARILATMIADRERVEESLLDRWVAELDNYVIADAFSAYVGEMPFARQKMESWIRSPDEWVGVVGWNLLSHLALKDNSLPEGYLEEYLVILERDLHNSKNRVRYSMNGALIAIGLRNQELERKALAAAERIGRVMVDHGETGCKTPDADAYIRKARGRRK